MKKSHFIAYHHVPREEIITTPKKDMEELAHLAIADLITDLILRKNFFSVEKTEHGLRYYAEFYIFTPKEIKEIIQKARNGEHIDL